jgi:hypothetical protein
MPGSSTSWPTDIYDPTAEDLGLLQPYFLDFGIIEGARSGEPHCLSSTPARTGLANLNQRGVGPGAFKHKGSVALVNDFSCAEGLLDQCVEGHVHAVQRALKTDLEISVKITCKGLN